MPSLWNIESKSREKLADEWEDEEVLEDKVEQHRHKFEDYFRENMNQEVPTHPYKIYRKILESQELSDEERIALEHIKDEFSEEWQSLKQKSSHNLDSREGSESYSKGDLPDETLHDAMNTIVEQIFSMEAFVPYMESMVNEKFDSRLKSVPEENDVIAQTYFELILKDSGPDGI